MTNVGSRILSVVLVLAGAYIVFLGINVAFGGILTLGWQGQTKFLEITNEYAYLVQDSHVRFFGGIWGGMGLFFMLAATNLQKFQSALKVVFALIFIGGLARFTMMRPDIIFGPNVAGSLFAELILIPILFIWLSRTVKAAHA